MIKAALLAGAMAFAVCGPALAEMPHGHPQEHHQEHFEHHPEHEFHPGEHEFHHEFRDERVEHERPHWEHHVWERPHFRDHRPGYRVYEGFYWPDECFWFDPYEHAWVWTGQCY